MSEGSQTIHSAQFLRSWRFFHRAELGRSMLRPYKERSRPKKQLLALLIQLKRRSLIIAAQIELDAVVHPPRARSAFRRTRRGFAVDQGKFIFRRGVQPFELKH